MTASFYYIFFGIVKLSYKTTGSSWKYCQRTLIAHIAFYVVASSFSPFFLSSIRLLLHLFYNMFNNIRLKVTTITKNIRNFTRKKCHLIPPHWNKDCLPTTINRHFQTSTNMAGEAYPKFKSKPKLKPRYKLYSKWVLVEGSTVPFH